MNAERIQDFFDHYVNKNPDNLGRLDATGKKVVHFEIGSTGHILMAKDIRNGLGFRTAIIDQGDELIYQYTINPNQEGFQWSPLVRLMREDLEPTLSFSFKTQDFQSYLYRRSWKRYFGKIDGEDTSDAAAMAPVRRGAVAALTKGSLVGDQRIVFPSSTPLASGDLNVKEGPQVIFDKNGIQKEQVSEETFRPMVMSSSWFFSDMPVIGIFFYDLIHNAALHSNANGSNAPIQATLTSYVSQLNHPMLKLDISQPPLDDRHWSIIGSNADLPLELLKNTEFRERKGLYANQGQAFVLYATIALAGKQMRLEYHRTKDGVTTTLWIRADHNLQMGNFFGIDASRPRGERRGDAAMNTSQLSRQLLKGYTVDPPKAEPLAQEIQQAEFHGERDKEDWRVLRSAEGKILVKISDLDTKRFFDKQGHWILTIDHFGNVMEQLQYDQEGNAIYVEVMLPSGEYLGAKTVSGKGEFIMLEDNGHFNLIKRDDYSLRKILETRSVDLMGNNVEADHAQLNESETDLGGIDMNSANLNLHIKRDGNGIPILSQQDLAQLSNIEGLDPVILSIKPASQTALFADLVAHP